MRFSRTRLAVACSPGGIRRGPPRPVGSWRVDGSGEGDQSGAFGRPQFPAAPGGRPAVAFGHEDGEPVERVAGDLVELAGGGFVAGGAPPPPPEGIYFLRDLPASPPQARAPR